MRIPALLLIGAALLATPAQAQDFLGAIARRAAAAAASRVVEQALTPRAAPPADPARAAPQDGERASPAGAANPYADLESLSEPERQAACNRRVPLDDGAGRSYAAQGEFLRCMGPRYGEGG